MFLYRNVLQKDLAIPIHALHAKSSKHLPTILSKEETARKLSGTMIYTHVLNRGPKAVRSPLD